MQFRTKKHCDVILEESLVPTYSPASQCSLLYDSDRKTLDYDQFTASIGDSPLSVIDLAPISDDHALLPDDGVDSSEILEKTKIQNELLYNDLVDFTFTETESSHFSDSEYDFSSDSESIVDQDVELYESRKSISAADPKRSSTEMAKACVDRLQARISSRSSSTTPSFPRARSSINTRYSTDIRSTAHGMATHPIAKTKEYDPEASAKTSTRRAESVLVSSRCTMGGVSFRFEEAPISSKEKTSPQYLTRDENSLLHSQLENLALQLYNIDCLITSFEKSLINGRSIVRSLVAIINHELEQLRVTVHQLRSGGSALLRVYSNKVYATELLGGIQRYVMHAKSSSARIDRLIVAVKSFKSDS